MTAGRARSWRLAPLGGFGQQSVEGVVRSPQVADLAMAVDGRG